MIPTEDDPQGYRFFDGGFPDSYEGAVLKTDFRVWLRQAIVVRQGDMTDAAKFKVFVELCYKTIPAGTPPETLLRGIEWFSRCGESDRLDLLRKPRRLLDDIERVAAERLERPRSFDFFWDFKEIWASFRGAYGIDLYKDDLTGGPFAGFWRGWTRRARWRGG